MIAGMAIIHDKTGINNRRMRGLLSEMIAAAPDMLRALKQLSKNYGMEVASIVFPVINKAEGRI